MTHIAELTQREPLLHILFVCTGNICRSPLAERLAVTYAEQISFQGFRASSAGTRAVVGHEIHHHAASVLEELGGRGAGFRARQLNAKVMVDVDLILTMTREHRDKVLEMSPRYLRKTFTLAEAARLASESDAAALADLAALRPQLTSNDQLDIDDPIGHGSEVFAAVGEQISRFIPPVIDLCQRSSNGRD